MRAEDATGRSVLPRSRKTRAVLAVLALAGSKPVLRSRLTALLWSSRAKDQARGSLRQSLHELQLALGPIARALLQADRNCLMLLDDRLWVDACALARATVSQPATLDLFQPTLLDDLSGLDPAFDLWLAAERRQVAQRARSVAEGLLAVQSEIIGKIAAAEQLLSIDRVHEGAWQALIRAYGNQRDYAAVRVAFERCTASLSQAGLPVSDETRALVESMTPAQSGNARKTQRRGMASGIRLAILPPRPLDSNGLGGLFLGLAEEITVALSRFRWISCIVGTTSAIGAGDGKPAGAARKEHSVDVVLDSTLQCSGKRVRIIARLLDVHSGGRVIWARCFDRELADALTLQGEIAAELAAQIDPELLLREGDRLVARNTYDRTAHDLVLRAIPAIYRLEPLGFHAAGELLASAVEIEPGNAAAHAWWAYWHLFLVGQGWATDPVTATLRAGELAERAVTLDPGDARALALVGHVRAFLYKRAQEGCILHERALSLNPNLPLAWCFSGLAHSYLGHHEDAIDRIAQAQRLSPHDPHAFFFDMTLMMPHFLRGEFDNAAAIGRRAVELNPGCSSSYKGYLATLGQLRHDQEATRVLERLVLLEPGFSVRNAIERSPMTRGADLALYADGLRRGGLREG